MNHRSKEKEEIVSLSLAIVILAIGFTAILHIAWNQVPIGG